MHVVSVTRQLIISSTTIMVFYDKVETTTFLNSLGHYFFLSLLKNHLLLSFSINISTSTVLFLNMSKMFFIVKREGERK